MVQTRSQRLALAFALTWLRVAGSNSVLPPWVRLEHPLTGELIRRLRDVPCNSPRLRLLPAASTIPGSSCARFSVSMSFAPAPRATPGAACSGRLSKPACATSRCWPFCPRAAASHCATSSRALVRNYRRGVLTIVLSPLQALMKDQVDGLVRRTGTSFAAALYGLLTPPERGDVLRRIRLGDVAMLYVSPEQLRNRSFPRPLPSAKSVAGCSTKPIASPNGATISGPDYLYAGRFIREFSKKQGGEIPAIACFTATAKQDVKEEILAYFKTETGRELKLFEGGRRARQPAFRGPDDRRVTASSSGSMSCSRIACPRASRAAPSSFAPPARPPRLDRGIPADPRLESGPFPRRLDAAGQEADPGRVPGRGHPGHLRHQRLRDGHRQGRRAPGHPRRHPGLAGELPAGSRSRRT